MKVYEVPEKIKEDVVKWRRDLHRIPETGTELPKTAAYVKNVLDGLGVEYKDNVGLKDAIVATVKGTKEGEGKTIALRGDMDALPVKEDTGLEFSSENENMHACGHDAHAAMLLATVAALNEIKDKFSGTVKFFFQPAEEISGGAEPMIKAGALKNPDADLILGLHVGNIGEADKPGQFLFARGSMMACLDKFLIKVTGKGSHGAYPHASHDTVVITANIINALQEIISREIDPAEPGVITIGRVSVGDTYNVIPETAELEGTLRAVNEETRNYLAKRIEEVSKGIAETFRGKAEFIYSKGAPPLVNNDELTMKTYETTKRVFGEEDAKFMDKPVMGGEDFAYYLKEIPGAFIFMYNPLEIGGQIYPHHNPKFAIDDSLLDRGVKLFVNSVLELMEEK